MDIYPIWQTTYFEYSGNSVTFRILKGTSEIFRGKAVKSPADSLIRVELNKLCATHINSLLGNETLNAALEEDIAIRTEAYCVFTIQTLNEGSGLWNTYEEVAFFNDTSYEENEEMALNEPINGHAAPGQFIPATVMVTGESAETCYEVICNGEGPTPISGEYLTLEITDKYKGNTLTWSGDTGGYYSIDSGVTWMPLERIQYTYEPKPGDIVFIKGDSVEGTFSGSTAHFNVYGNVMSLQYGDDFADKTALNGSLEHLFMDTYVQSAENLELPATALTANCYAYMFAYCPHLKKAPKSLPATTLATTCYSHMFYRCTNLVTGPEELPATTLPMSCYRWMFTLCRNLKDIPATLPATELSPYCYERMFYGCDSLTTVPAISATVFPAWSCHEMFRYCTKITTTPVMNIQGVGLNACEGMFMECFSLVNAPIQFPTSTSRRCFIAMFAYCYSLTTDFVLPATGLTEQCYGQMFYKCNLVDHVECLGVVENTFENNYTEYWLYDASPTGTFVKNANSTWATGASFIPYGWTVVDAS